MGIAANLAAVKAAISVAATKAGRQADEIHLIAVSKTNPASAVAEALAAGQLDFGENRVQEMVEKQAEIPQARWHMIGVLQRNKVRQIAGFVHLIHSIDSERLLEEVNRQAGLHNRVIDCLLQINISDEDQKSGMDEADAELLLTRISDYPHVRVHGLMGMAEFTEDMDVVREQFRRLARARERLRRFNGLQVEMKELSMGMSGDYAVAIAEGATMVRIGSSIFGDRR
jgi:PLP dependent protein